MLFSWLRSRVRAAILSGINDAIDVLDVGDTQEDVGPQLTLRLRLLPAPALPEADEDEAPAAKRRKGVAS